MGEVTHDQANLLLRLYELRREPRLREAREWYFDHFKPASVEDAMKIGPPGSNENSLMRMVTSYWDMAASMVNRGLIDEDFFFENTGEQWLVWERIKPLFPPCAPCSRIRTTIATWKNMSTVLTLGAKRRLQAAPKRCAR
jgi:hypothetical protein